jgi:O-antigen/teichoic acid export membrane protein
MKKKQPKENLSKRFLPNAVMNVSSLVVTGIIGLLMVPYYIDSLGIAAYGIVPVALSMTGYMTIVADSISNATYRYLVISIQKGDYKDANLTYSTAVYGLLLIVAITIPIVALFSYMTPELLDITGNDARSVRILFMCILGSVLITVWSNVFGVVLMANNRMDLQSLTRIIQSVSQAVLIVILFVAFNPSIIGVGVAYLSIALATMGMYHMFSRRVSPELKSSRKNFSMNRFKEIAGVSGWNLVNTIGNLLFIQMSLIIANVFFGSAAGGEFSIVASIVSIIVALGTAITNTFSPIVYNKFATGHLKEMTDIAGSAVKIVGMLMAPVLAFICVFSSQALTIWVGEEFAHLSGILWIMLIFMVGFEAIAPVNTISLAHLKIKVPAVMTVVFGILNMALAYAFFRLGYGLEGIAGAWAISMFIKNCVFYPWYHAKICGLKGFAFHKPLIYGFAGFAISAVLFYGLDYVVGIPANLIVLIVLFVVLIPFYLIPAVKYALNDSEKSLVKSCIPEKLHSRIPGWLL